MNRASARLMPSRVSCESVRRYVCSPESLKNVSVRRILLLSALLYLGTFAWAGGGHAEEAGQSLRNELEALSARHGFAIVGSDKLEAGSTAFDNGGKLSKRLESLLGGYNFILMFDAAGAVRELHILGPRPTAEELERRIAVKTTRRGSHHVVDAIVIGPTGAERTIPFVVDTGSSTVVLPSSMMAELGFQPSDLKDAEGRTAAGPVPIKVGKLSSVRVGRAHVHDVTVSFIEDAKIGEQHLLGMSFLNRFRLTIDDAGNRIILLPR